LFYRDGGFYKNDVYFLKKKRYLVDFIKIKHNIFLERAGDCYKNKF